MKEVKEVTIVRSKRKTVSLEVTKNAEVVVRAPLRASDTFIQTFIQKHLDWIEKQKKEMSAKKVGAKEFVDGEMFLFLGKQYRLSRIYDKKYQGVTLIKDEGVMCLGCAVSDPKKVFEEWYKKRAHELIISRVHELAAGHGFVFNAIRITSAKTRWGSCSGKKNLSFSWRLMMAPAEVIDYVIVHELTHLRHMNHSKRFWVGVEKLCPRYKEYKKWLREHASKSVSW